jgi:hypothetical protein
MFRDGLKAELRFKALPYKALLSNWTLRYLISRNKTIVVTVDARKVIS